VSTRNTAGYRDPAVIAIDQMKEIYIDGTLEPIETANWFPKVIRKDYTVGANISELEFVSADSTGEHQAFLCRRSGKVYWYVEYSDDELSELPDDIDDREKYVQIPAKKELDPGKPLVLEFVRQTQPSEIRRPLEVPQQAKIQGQRHASSR
jgi:hypothetical protein